MNCCLQDVDEVIDRPTIGCSKPITALSEADRARWVRGLFRRDVLLHQMNAVVDFQAGLQPMLDTWKSTPEAVEAAMQFLSRDSIPDLTEAAFLQLFELNRYGTERSQLYKDENKAYYWFESFLKDVHRGLATCKTEAQREDFQPPVEDIAIRVSDVLMFFTGSTTVPPGGFSSVIMLHFDRGCTLPRISTCALNATMPLNAIATHRKGKDNYCYWLLPGSGFGVD
ncbi:PREDICTED: uncharacterized protein LOC106812933 [Priapulus caudatus]|uniref:Uncharacterized protein LOC106812933 n=1 Tax=Priapulus caudatus TaxID=37621 RepID=A0ABM1EJQ7_PRICU|nr:PREDICTED: uncharacterized protein LOC106812933 [Priapulus caudatus]